MAKRKSKKKAKGYLLPKYQTGADVESIPSHLLPRQAYKESTFRDSAKSSAGALGLTQFLPATFKELKEDGKLPADADIYNIENSIQAQKEYVKELYNRPWNTKEDPTEEVRIAKTLGAYNYGPQNLIDFLNIQKEKGIDIYKTLDWVPNLPKETKDYIEYITGTADSEKYTTWDSDYKKALKNSEYKRIVDAYGEESFNPNSYTRPYKEGENRSVLNLKNRNQPSIQRPFNPEFPSRVIDNTSEQEIPLSPKDLEDINRIYDKKTTKEEIGNIQHKLDSLGYNIGSAGVDSLAGDSTELALKQFALDQVNDRPAPIDIKEPTTWYEDAYNYISEKFKNFENGGKVESYENGTEVVIPNSENKEVLLEQPVQQELPHKEIVSFPTEREPYVDPKIPMWANKDYYKNIYNTNVRESLAKQYSIWKSIFKSPDGINIEGYKNIYDIQEFFNSGEWRKGFKNVEKYRKPSHPMLGEIDPETLTFMPSERNVNTNEEIADYILQENIPVNFKKVERIPINPDGFAPGSATEFADKVVIPSNNITTKDMQEPILANGEVLMPGEEAQFDSDYVVEEKLPKAQDGLTVTASDKLITYNDKQGNRISFTGDSRKDNWINDQLDTGKFGYNEKTGALTRLQTPQKGISEEDTLLKNKGKYREHIGNRGFTTSSQDSKIANLSKEEQKNINAINKKERQDYVFEQQQEMFRNPITYAPGAIAVGMLGGPAVLSGLGRAAPWLGNATGYTGSGLQYLLESPLVHGTSGTSIGNLINYGFGVHGVTNIAPDAENFIKNPSFENALNVGIDALEMAAMYGPMSKMLGELGTIGKSSKPTSAAAIEGVLPTIKQPIPSNPTIVPPVTKTPPWSMQEMPGLHLKSTMTGSPLEKGLTKKGEIVVKNIEAYLNKPNVSEADKSIIQKVLNTKFKDKSRIDYNDFRKAVSSELTTLNRTSLPNIGLDPVNWNSYTEGHKGLTYTNYGLHELGYESTWGKNMLEANLKKGRDVVKTRWDGIKERKETLDKLKKFMEPEEFKKIEPYLQNQIKEETAILESEKAALKEVFDTQKNLKKVKTNEAVGFENPKGFGSGSDAHYSETTMGHSRQLVSEAEPEVMHVIETQSDLYQKEGMKKLKNIKTETPTKLERRQRRFRKTSEDLENDKIRLKELVRRYHNKLPDEQGNEIHQWQINNARQDLAKKIKEFELKQTNFKNWEEKYYLGKNHLERFLQEDVVNAAQKGHTKMRYPTRETAIKIQKYKKVTREDITPQYIETVPEGSDPYHWVGQYVPSQETILKQYSSRPKTIKKLFGKEPSTVTDSNGNTWYEFDIPKSYLERKAEIKAFEYGGKL